MRILNYIIIICFITNYTLSKDLLYSDEYEIQFSSENIKLKKEEIINLIKYKSFNKLINFVLTNDDYKRINKIMSIDLINSFIFSLDINEEKINNLHYSSKIKLAYDNSKIIDYFIHNNINFVPYEPEKFLLIIFDQKLFSEKILSKENNFYQYLLSQEIKYKYFAIPNLDINDRYIIKKEDILLQNLKNFEKILKKYKYNYLILVHSISDLEGATINSYVYKNNNIQIIDNISFLEINYKSFFYNLENKALNYWKNNNIVLSSNINKIKCEIKTLNLIELKKIKEIINNNIIIKKINANKISYNNSTYDLFYYGNLDILIKSLIKDKLELKAYNNNCSIKIL